MLMVNCPGLAPNISAYIDTIAASGFITEVFSHPFLGFLVKRPAIVNTIPGRCTRLLGKTYLKV